MNKIVSELLKILRKDLLAKRNDRLYGNENEFDINEGVQYQEFTYNNKNYVGYNEDNKGLAFVFIGCRKGNNGVDLSYQEDKCRRHTIGIKQDKFDLMISKYECTLDLFDKLIEKVNNENKEF